LSRTVSFEFDPFKETGVDLPEGADREEVLQEIADVILDETKSYMGNANSPVAGYGKFPKLSKGYKKYKIGQGGSGQPDLELFGDMKDSMEVSIRGSKVKIKITGKEGDKADGHCNFSGESSLPLRRFIPNAEDDETFKAPILAKIKKIIIDG
jgi:hypothetical protein